ncbi:MAG: ATP-binding protein, partial [Acidobacteriota bacterium]
NLGRVTTAARGMSRIGRESGDVARAKANEDAAESQRQELAAALDTELQTLQQSWSDDSETFERVVVKPKRGGVQVQLVALVWRPE